MPASLRQNASSQEALEREIVNDKGVLAIWQRWVHPLKTEYGERWVEAQWVEALAGFYRETGEADLETEGFFRRNGTTLTALREKYKAGPPDYVRPGFRSPHLGERFDLSRCLPSLRALGWSPAPSSNSSPSPPDLMSGQAVAAESAAAPALSSTRRDGSVRYHAAGSRNAWDGTEGKVVLIEFWASWCDGCVAAFPALSLLQETYAPLLQVISINNTHVFAPDPRRPPVTAGQADEARRVEWRFLSEVFGEAWAERGVGGKEGNVVDPLPYTIWEDTEGKVTEDVFKRVDVPFIPNAFLFVNGRLFWQGEPDIQDQAIGFAKAVEEAVEIAGGVRGAPEWFREADEG